MITVVTWNVLHRVHAENYEEDLVRRWPSEAERIAAVTARLAARAEYAIALQEVSGDQLASLREGLPARTIHAMRYPRVPTLRQGSPQLSDPAEYLVLLVDGDARPVAAEPFEHDRGKGLLAVETGGTIVASTHVSFGELRRAQLTRLAEVARDWPGPAVLLGDFNADRRTVAAGLGQGFTAGDPGPDSPPTRPGAGSPFIDHAVAHRAEVTAVVVEDGGGLSDHSLLRATVTKEVRNP